MKQVLHIFAKDARHQWLEILLSLAVTVGLVFACPSRWRTGAAGVVSFSPWGLASNLPDIVVYMVPLSWWLLISPVIHEEKLVGDRQFWITRPYDWKKLLAAKVLFLIAFLYVPLLLAQCAMLAEAGFTPFPSLPDLLRDSRSLTCLLVLPLVVLATVTRNFARMTLAVLGAAGCFIAFLLLALNASPDRIAIPHENEIEFLLALGLCVAVVVVQYARRNARVSWSLLALLVMIVGVSALGGAPDNAQMARDYPPGQRGIATAQFAYQQTAATAPSAFVTQRRDRVGISIPVLVSGEPDGTVTIPDFLQVTLQALGGARWTSVWQTATKDKFLPGERVANAQFTMPRAAYDDFKEKPLNVQVTFALTQAHAEKVERLTLGQKDFAVPGVGVCSPVKGFADRLDEIGLIACRSPLRQPELTLVNSAWSAASCGDKSQSGDDGVQTAAWIGSLEKESTEFGIIPVSLAPVNFSNQFVMEPNRPGKARHFCPGTPVTFTRYTLTERTQSTIWIHGFQLPLLDSGQITVMNQD
jgi:hypothetical protein